MDIKFTGKYKSITAFEWLNIPKFAVITGPNGTGKSQPLKLIYNTIIQSLQQKETVDIKNESIQRHEISFITLQYPKWITKRSGRVIVNRVYTQVFEPKGKVINFDNVEKAFRKINLIPNDIIDLFNEIR
ncbi:MAG: hypothetical protein QNJ08_11570 [Crocosphaera sp.]|nr:hypothetical protein [Crocosphaera sp.]